MSGAPFPCFNFHLSPLLARAPSAPCGGPFRSVLVPYERRARHASALSPFILQTRRWHGRPCLLRRCRE